MPCCCGWADFEANNNCKRLSPSCLILIISLPSKRRLLCALCAEIVPWSWDISARRVCPAPCLRRGGPSRAGFVRDCFPSKASFVLPMKKGQAGLWQFEKHQQVKKRNKRFMGSTCREQGSHFAPGSALDVLCSFWSGGFLQALLFYTQPLGLCYQITSLPFH